MRGHTIFSCYARVVRTIRKRCPGKNPFGFPSGPSAVKRAAHVALMRSEARGFYLRRLKKIQALFNVRR